MDRERKAAAREALRRRVDEQAGSGAPASAGESVFEAPSPAAQPVRHRAKETFVAGEGTGGGSAPKPAGFTGSLLEAKKRAKKKM